MNSSTYKRERLLILVKTYPTLSTKYDELVCTAGMTPDGRWLRLYPIVYRKLDFDKWYKKYQWVEIDVQKNTSDPRPESFRPYNMCEDITFHGSIDTKNGWEKRRQVVLRNVYDDLGKLIADNKRDDAKQVSLAVFKPTRVLDFKITPAKQRTWDPEKLKAIESRKAQRDLFGGGENPFKIMDKLPYEFRYEFEDMRGKRSALMIEDWEIGQLYWNCLERAEGDEAVACAKVREKYFDEFLKRDLYFFMGTTRRYNEWADNPFLIIGCFWPPKREPTLFE
ncbi:MAG: hypothetical protein Q7R81_07590 [Candidatus Peregrinibacteria bacterium]|nr:hypothetical protein [Candidatus Peregrinibacteria bacterium]